MEKAKEIARIFKKVFGKPPALFLFLSLIIISVLFRGGNIVGGGEAGAAFYSLKRMFEMSKDSWAEVFFGMPSGLTVAAAPMFALLAFLQGISIPGFILQALFFMGMAFLTLYSMYIFTSELFPEAPKKLWVFSSLFYLFNPYSIMNIWNRFLPNVNLFYSFLPLGLALFIRGLKLKDYRYSLLLAILTAIFSYAFAAPAQSLFFWFLILLTGLFQFVFVQRNIYVLKYFFLTILLWSIANFWWISQEIYYRFSGLFAEVSGSVFTASGNLETLRSLSESLGKISNILLLQHGTFYTTATSIPFRWPLFYSHPLSLILQWLVIILVLFIAIRKRNQVGIKFLLLLFVISVFFSKGTSEPLGELFYLAFKKISLLEFFRNPFEKLGPLIPLSISPLFGVAVYEIELGLGKIRRAFGTLTKVFFVFYLFIFMGFPFFTGLVFTSYNPPANNFEVGYQVKVPQYYQEADGWLSSVGDDFRFMSLPIGGEGIFYNWEKGYAGVEESAVLFSKPSFSYGTTALYFQDIINSLERLFIEHVDFYKIARLLNIRYILFRPDFDFRLSNMRDPATLEKLLEDRVNTSEAKLSFAKKFDRLKFYEFSADTPLPKFFIGGQPIETNKIGNLEDIYWGKAEKNDFLVLAGTGGWQGNVKASLFYLSAIFKLKGPNALSYSNDSNIIPFVERTPTDRIYPLVLLREKLTKLLTLELSSKTEYELMILGKRVVEAKLAGETGDQEAVKKSLTLYRNALDGALDKIRLLSWQEGKRLWREDFVRTAFETHLILLNELEKSFAGDAQMVSFIDDTQRLIREKSSKLGIMPTHEVAVKDDFPIDDRVVYHFEVGTPGEYELVFPEKSWSTYFNLPSSMPIQINQEIKIKSFIFSDEGYPTLEKIYFDKGINEIGFNLTGSKNLVDFKDQISINNVGNPEGIKYSIKNFDPRVSYNVFFDYDVRSGLSPKVSLVQNTDKTIDGKVQRIYEETSPQDNYWFDFRSFSEQIAPAGYADFADLIITVEPWNDCEQLFSFDKSKCSDMGLREKFNRKSESAIKNLKVEKALPREPFLRNTGSMNASKLPEIEMASTKISTTKYLVSIKGANGPFTLIFSELFNPGWKIYEGRENLSLPWATWGKKPLLGTKHYLVNGYANAWNIDKNGDYNLVVEYWPQRILSLGYLISGLFAVGGIVYLYLNRNGKRQ